ncbi:NUDIX hydrolase [Pelagibacteraceae bacterium]|nr:NUDIX hydrolase [Pelagibacteraceae bacterium]
MNEYQNYQINHTLSNANESNQPLIPAATVLLVRDHNSKIEVFMIKRAIKTNFGGAWVFPGGKVDSSDDIKNINKYSPLLNDQEASRRLGIKSGGLIYWIACIRECFEESGILLADNEQKKINLGSLTSSELKIINQYKKKLLEGKDVFSELIDKFDLTLSTNEIAYISHWITPRIEKRRYSTRFFIARCPNQLASHDGLEGVESRWLEPKVALDLYKSGEFPMIMPTIKNLELVKDFQDTQTLLLSMNDKLISDIPKVEPVFDVVDGKPKLISY